MTELENEMQDLLHYIEMAADKNAAVGSKLYKKLADIRRRRRICKNEIDLLTPVYEQFHATQFLEHLSQL